ncbi:MAG: methyltransferase domain-containing protein [Herpetosiphonaceae bacterium]|nr:methyltransferase domain-containing protein [Herpetosiphonaceae bacterium]
MATTTAGNNLTQRIRNHYNLLAPFYYLLWGQHVHHGYWDDATDQSGQAVAQERLIQELYAFAGAPQEGQLIDIGCGYAGSLIWLAHHARLQGQGITLSRFQQLIGHINIRRQHLTHRLQVQVADAQHTWDVADGSRTLVWCIECSEHLSDRVHFAREAYRVLAPGGTLALAAWLASTDASSQATQLRQAVAHGMLCPPFGSAADYETWLRAAGFEDVAVRLITPHVIRTWDLSIALQQRPLLRWLSDHLGRDVAAFTASFADLRQAYLDGAMDYGLFVAHKPRASESSRV